MKNASSKKGWMTDMNQPHVEPPPIPLIKENHDGKSDKDFVKLKLRIVACDTLLTYPDFNETFKIYTNARAFQLGAVVIQIGKPISF